MNTNDLKESLTRKLGPLPVWAWALIAGVAVYLYRIRSVGGSALTSALTGAGASGGGSGVDAGNGTGAVGSGGGIGGGGDPVTLQPGETVYDPNNGKLVSGAPEQQVPPTEPDAPESIVLEEGQAVYDPKSGKLTTNRKPAAPKVVKAKAKAKPRKAKPKPKNKKAVTKPGTGTKHKTKARGRAKIKNPLRKQKPSTKPPKGRARGKGNAAKPVSRVRAHTARTPALRQRPAAPRVVNHAAQRTAPHPAPHPAAHPAPGHRAAAHVTTPARRRRK